MKIIVTKDYSQMSKLAAELFAQEIRGKPDAVLGLATGSTPLGMYRELIQMNKEKRIDFSSVRTFNLDEYYRISPENENSYLFFMKKNLFDHINIKPSNINIPYGAAQDPIVECMSYDQKIEAAGGIDVQMLGVGNNGHIGFNEPDEDLYFGTHLANLQQSTIEANARFFNTPDRVPRQALTMGVGHIMQAKKIVTLISGSNKREVLKALKVGRITTNCPATLLVLHPNAIILADEEACM